MSAGVARKMGEAHAVLKAPCVVDPPEFVFVPVGPYWLEGEVIGPLEDGDVIAARGSTCVLVDLHDGVGDDMAGVRCTVIGESPCARSWPGSQHCHKQELPSNTIVALAKQADSLEVTSVDQFRVTVDEIEYFDIVV